MPWSSLERWEEGPRAAGEGVGMDIGALVEEKFGHGSESGAEVVLLVFALGLPVWTGSSRVDREAPLSPSSRLEEGSVASTAGCEGGDCAGDD